MSALETLRDAIDADAPVAAEIIARLHAGDRLVALKVNEVGRRAATLEAVLEQLTDKQTKLAWIGNPLRSPLTIERLFLQAVGAEADLRVERSPADLAAMLVRAGAPACRFLLLLQQPETLDPEARETIAALAECLPDAEPQVQFLFCGTEAFALPQPAAIVAAAAIAAAPDPEPTPPRRARERLPLLLLLLLIGLAALASPALLQHAGHPIPPPEPLAAQTSPQAFAPAPALPASTVPATPPATVDVASLRREFDAFLSERKPSVTTLSEEEKNVLFQEFLDHRRRLTLQAN